MNAKSKISFTLVAILLALILQSCVSSSKSSTYKIPEKTIGSKLDFDKAVFGLLLGAKKGELSCKKVIDNVIKEREQTPSIDTNNAKILKLNGAIFGVRIIRNYSNHEELAKRYKIATVVADLICVEKPEAKYLSVLKSSLDYVDSKNEIVK